MSPPDPNDVDFLRNLKDLLGIDVKDVEYLIPRLDPRALIDLAAAVTNSDRQAALAIIKSGREQYRSRDVSEAMRARKPRSGTVALDPASFVEFAVGEAVRVDGQEATIRVPKGPGDSVGVMLGGKLEMVNRDDITKIKEGVLGMANIPDIRRMQELAGIAGPNLPDAVINSPPIEVPSVAIEPVEDAMDECGASALALLDDLACMLPNLRLGDIKAVRKRLYEITNQLNESVSGKREDRKAKV